MEKTDSIEAIESLTDKSDLQRIIKTFFELQLAKPVNEPQSIVCDEILQAIDFVANNHLFDGLSLKGKYIGVLEIQSFFSPQQEDSLDSVSKTFQEEMDIQENDAKIRPNIDRIIHSKNSFTFSDQVVPNKGLQDLNNRVIQPKSQVAPDEALTSTQLVKTLPKTQLEQHFFIGVNLITQKPFFDLNELVGFVKLANEYFSQKIEDIQNKNLKGIMAEQNGFEKLSNNNLKESSSIQLIFTNNKIFDNKFIQLIKEQSSIPQQIKTMLPSAFGIVGYHYKEKTQKIILKKKKKKKGKFFKKELKYTNENFN